MKTPIYKPRIRKKKVKKEGETWDDHLLVAVFFIFLVSLGYIA